jgi:hypothetical protein
MFQSNLLLLFQGKRTEPNWVIGREQKREGWAWGHDCTSGYQCPEKSYFLRRKKGIRSVGRRRGEKSAP